MFNPYMFCLFVAVFIAAVSQILLKIGASKTYKVWWREYLNPWVIGGYGLLFGSMMLDIVAYTGVEYKNGPVMESMGNVLVPLLSFLLLKEKMTLRKIVGTLVIVCGMFVFYM